jgi:toxin ParE1/3/4
MNYTVLILDEAEQDLLHIHGWVRSRFTRELANEVYLEIRDDILLLERHPFIGPPIESLLELGMTNFRHMVVQQKNRVVYEIDEPNHLIYVHMICNERQDYETLLKRRILR